MTKKLNTQDLKLEKKEALAKFASENLKATVASTSAKVIEEFAIKIHEWLQVEYVGVSLNPELITQQIYDLAKYKGQQKNEFGIITNERNTTFEKNVSRSYLVAEIWYYKEEIAEDINTTKSPYLYFKNGMLIGNTDYHKINDERDFARLSLEGIKDFHSKIFNTSSSGSHQKTLLKKLNDLNEESFNKLIKAFVRTPSPKDQKAGRKEISFDYEKFAESSQQDFQEIRDASLNFLSTITFFQGLILYCNDDNNFDPNDVDNTTPQVSAKVLKEHLQVIKSLQAKITKANTKPQHDGGIEEASDQSTGTHG